MYMLQCIVSFYTTFIMKIHTRKCANIDCKNILENTRTRSIFCGACASNSKTSIKIQAERTLLEGLGYINIQEPSINKFSQRIWTFTHSACETEQTWTFGNLQTRLKKDPDSIPCSYCGAKRRTENANAKLS